MNYDQNMRGVLFRNDKGDNEARPDYRDSATINGQDFSVSGRIKASKKTGDKFLSLKFEVKPSGNAAGNGKPALTEKNWALPDMPF